MWAGRARGHSASRAKVALLARGRDGLDAAAREVQTSGGAAFVCVVDIADAAAVEAAADEVERELGPIDVWINSAVAIVHSPVAEITAEEVRRVTQTSYLGFVHGTLAALRRMRARDHGTIVQVNSALAHRGIPLLSSYCAAKHAVQGFTESLRVELRHDRSAVRVSVVELAGINTPLYDVMRTRVPCRPRGLAPLYQPEVAAEAVLWAAEHRPRLVRVGGSAFGIVIANRFVPDLID
ncbi:MAG: SDR family oxidoreductase, partial [Solirubrobacteraceae bacterium]